MVIIQQNKLYKRDLYYRVTGTNLQRQLSMLLEGVLKKGHQEESNVKEASGRPMINVENSPFLTMYSEVGGSQQHGPMLYKVWKIVISIEKCEIKLLIFAIIKNECQVA